MTNKEIRNRHIDRAVILNGLQAWLLDARIILQGCVDACEEAAIPPEEIGQMIDKIDAWASTANEMMTQAIQGAKAI